MTLKIYDWVGILAKPPPPNGYQDSEARHFRNKSLSEAFPDVRLGANNFSNINQQAFVTLRLSSGGWLTFSKIKSALLVLEPHIIARPDNSKMFGVVYTNMHNYGPADLWFVNGTWLAQVKKQSRGMHAPKVFSSTDLHLTLQLLFHAIYGDIK